MKIGLNATCFNDSPSGAKQRFIGIYGELIKRLPEAQFVVYEPRDCRVSTWFEGAPNVTAKRTQIPSKGRFRKFASGFSYWHRALAHEQFDIFECLSLPLVKAPSGQNLLTIHDVRGLRAESGILESAAYKLFFANSLRAADHLITVSESMKIELQSLLPDASISVIYNGIDPTAFSRLTPADLELVRHRYRLPNSFVLAVGHLERRKNYICLIDAISKLRDRGHNYTLVIVGNDNGERMAIDEHIKAAGLTDFVKLCIGMSDFEVRCIYRLCSLFVFPSSYEGFGIPVLEAMAAVRPMVLSDLPVFREITHDQSVYFACHDSAAIAAAIDSVLSSSVTRNSLISYGIERVKDFGFQSLAFKMESLYRSIILDSRSL